jgi:hypothetical protein
MFPKIMMLLLMMIMLAEQNLSIFPSIFLWVSILGFFLGGGGGDPAHCSKLQYTEFIYLDIDKVSISFWHLRN